MKTTLDLAKVGEPVLTISLSLELIWGYVNTDTKRVKQLKKDPTHGRRAVRGLLGLLDKYEVPATWAVIGHLFLDHCDKDSGEPHKDMPRFRGNWYDVDPCTNMHQAPLFYGRDLVEEIISSKVDHEIGYHSFSHVIFSECSEEVAEAEIKKGIEIAKKEYSIDLRSFIFPQNKIGHIDLLRKYGFTAYRGENLWQSTLSSSLFRSVLNAQLNSMVPHPAKPRWENGILNIPTSMLFPSSPFPLSGLLKAKLGLLRTIRNGGVFHISMHSESLLGALISNQLSIFLSYAHRKKEQGKLRILTMAELASYTQGR
jgi:hypothetical protein